MNGSATGSSGYTYAYYYKRASARSWTAVGEEFTEATSKSFTPKNAGEYKIKIDIRDVNNDIVSKEFDLTVE